MTLLDVSPELGQELTRSHRHPALRWAGTRTPTELLELARDYGAEPSLVQRHTQGDPLTERRYELVELTDDVEIWVIHWPVDGRLELHDHGGSSGALWVVGGNLHERFVDGREVAQRTLVAGAGAAFGSRYVHDVVNQGPTTATSVHAYSPPMPAMTYYRSSLTGLTADRTEYRSNPSWAP